MDDLNYNLDAEINNIKISFLENKNKELENNIFELKNIMSLEDKLDLYEKNKILTEENNLLKEKVARLETILNIVEKENSSLNTLTESCITQMKIYEKEIYNYKNKKKKPKKKKYKVSDLIELKKEGKTYKEIAQMYGVSPSTIHYRIHKLDKDLI